MSGISQSHALPVVQLADADKERLRLEEHQVVIADVVRGEVCEEWRSVIGQMADEHEVGLPALLHLCSHPGALLHSCKPLQGTVVLPGRRQLCPAQR